MKSPFVARLSLLPGEPEDAQARRRDRVAHGRAIA
jgi:hypothetical protein